MIFPLLMIHDEHGQMHAYDMTEVNRLIGYGWRIKENKPETITLKKIKEKRAKV